MQLRSKRKYSFEDFSKRKKIRLGKRKEEINLDNVINLGMPHIGEQIFESLRTDDLFGFLKVSETWKILAENILLKRCKGKMFEACQNGHSEVVKLLLEHYSSEENALNAKHKLCGQTAFMLACRNGHTEVVQILLNHSKSKDIIDLNTKDRYHKTAFTLACQNGHKEVVQILLNQPVGSIDLNAKDTFGNTGFTNACLKGHTDVVKLLLEHAEKYLSAETAGL